MDVPLPSNFHAEQSAIACLLNASPEELTYNLAYLKEDFFADKKFRDTYNGITQCVADKKSIDIITLSHYNLDSIDLMNIQASIATTAGFETYVKELKDQHARRKSILAANKIITQSRDKTTDPQTIATLFTDTYQTLQQDIADKKDRTIRDVARSAIEALRQQVISKGANICDTNIPWVDGALRCKKGQMHCIGARPGVGKTSLALQMCVAQSMSETNPKVVAYFCRETSAENLLVKIAAQECRLPLHQAMYAISGDMIKPFAEKIKSLSLRSQNNLYIFGAMDFDPTPQDIAIKCNNILNTRGQLDEIYIDYLTDLKIPTKAESMERGVAANLEFIKDNIQLKMNVMVTILCQLAREKDNTPPGMNDFQWSSKIEQIANAVSILWRDPAKYKREDEPPAIIDTLWRSVKNRDCPPWSRILKFHGASNTFDYDMHKYSKEDAEIE